MESVGAYEAKTHLPKLLDRVAKGERIVITRHGVPVATLQPATTSSQKPVREVIEQLKEFRGGNRLGGLPSRLTPASGWLRHSNAGVHCIKKPTGSESGFLGIREMIEEGRR